MSESHASEKRPDLSDLDLIRRAQMEDLHAYEQLVRRYQDRIYGFTYSMTGNRETAAALSRLVFSKAWKALGHFREQTEFSFWIDRIALHQTLKFCKKNKRRSPMHFEEFDPAVKQSESYLKFSSKGSVLRKMSLKEFQKKLNETLLALPHTQRATLILHDMHGVSSLEVAKLMGGTEGPAQSRLAQARKNLQSVFEVTEPELGDLLALKTYARPDAARTEKNIENTMHAVRTAHKKPSLHHFPDKSMGWMFAQPRYGVAALFIIFLALHLLDRPMPGASVEVAPLQIEPSEEEVVEALSTNLPPKMALPGMAPSDHLGSRALGDFVDPKK
ncbi:MAG: RNA polymerase sigma factor [Verrucomicrobia bacterium]|nr:RNA polymerase sigma factor [Verrucomicrobiota bacterium]